MPSTQLAASCVALVLLACPVLAQSVPCFERNTGVDLGLGDDQVSPSQALGFAFPFGGGSVTQISVSSNGFVWLTPDPANGCCAGDRAAFLAGSPRIAAIWTDLNPAASGAVRFAALPGRAVITWDQVVEFGQGAAFTVQLQLLADGSMVMFWEPAVAIAAHATLVGITPGNGATDPGAVDFAGGLPFDSGTTATIYEVFAQGQCDVAGSAIVFTRNGNGGYVVTRRTDCQFASFSGFGSGCPVAPTAYEFFANGALDLSGRAFDFTPGTTGGYDVTACTSACIDPRFATGTNLNLGDDAVARNLPLGFVFPYDGGTTSSIDVAANGCVYLQAGSIGSNRCCNGDPAQFLAEDASIAVLWQDLDPAAGGAVRTHQPNASTFVITWDAVREFNVAGSANTAQLQLFSDGRFRLAFGTVANQGHACVVGFTPGNGAVDPGSIDLSTAAPFSLGAGGQPVTLSGAFGMRPTLGSSFTAVVGDAPAGAVSGLALLGFTAIQGGAPLTAFGMPGCRLYLGVDSTLPFPVQGAYSQFSLTIPNQPSLAGVVLYVQAAIVAPGVNQLGVVVSNAARMELGT